MLIIFDWDGVFVDSLNRWFELCCIAQSQVQSGRSFIKNDFRYIQNLTFHDLARRVGMQEDLIENFCSILFDLQKDNPDTSPFFLGIIDATISISKKAKLAIVSSNSEWEIERYLKNAGIRQIFQAIRVGTDKRSKSEKIIEVMEKLEETRETTFMVGDSRGDIFQGKKAGVRTVAVSWGYQPKEQLLQENPEFIVDSVTELKQIFNTV